MDDEASTKRTRTSDLDEGREYGDSSAEEEDDEDYAPLSQTDNPAPFEACSQATSSTFSQLTQSTASGAPYSKSLSGASGKHKKLKFISKPKSLHDRCHGPITLEPLLVRVMDTREFQRLRNLKQLGGSVFVYPDASHSRFEHSLGVAHLSLEMVTHLKSLEQEQLRVGFEDERERFHESEAINARDVTCVSLAGLVHDLGHGPFSHMFEGFVNRIRRARNEPLFEHEDMSGAILRHLLHKNGIELTRYMHTTASEAAQDLAFVQALIHGLKPGDPMPPDAGRPSRKRFLFEIMSNHRNGIDVDKLDYFLRDSSSAFGESSPLIHVGRIIDSSAVRTVSTPSGANGEETRETTVCYEEKMAMDLLGLFRTRMHLHAHLYQHHVVNVIEEMITDALTAAQGVPIVRGSARPERPERSSLRARSSGSPSSGSDNSSSGGSGGGNGSGGNDGGNGNDGNGGGGNGYDLVEACGDVEAYVNLGDWVLEHIQSSCDPRFAQASLIVQRIHERRLYDQIGSPLTRRQASLTSEVVLALLVKECQDTHRRDGNGSTDGNGGNGNGNGNEASSSSCPVTEAGVLVKAVKVNYGKDPMTGKCGYPLKNVLFFNPKQPASNCYPIPENKIGELNLPKAWEECRFWVYVRDPKLKPLVERAWAVVRETLNFEGRAMEATAMQNSPAKDLNSPAYLTHRYRRGSTDSTRSSLTQSPLSSRRRSLNSSLPAAAPPAPAASSSSSSLLSPCSGGSGGGDGNGAEGEGYRLASRMEPITERANALSQTSGDE